MIKKIIFWLLLLFIISITFLSLSFLLSLSSATGTSFGYFPKIIMSAIWHPTLNPDLNFLILGLDPRNDSLEKTETTDTIMLVHLTPTAKINLISIPRDLWVYSLNNKINQIYPLSLTQPDKYFYIQNEFTKLTGQKIDRTVILTTQSLVELTRQVGGVDINLSEGFIDNQYPNPEYIKHPDPKIPMYITIEFKKGIVHLDENNITFFVRSRKSLIGGTDIGRIQRQQLLLEALINKIKSPSYYKNIHNLVNLYIFYKNYIVTNFQDQDFVSLGIKIYPYISALNLTKFSIPTGDNPQTDILYHPAIFLNRQWVFIPQDKDYKKFQEYIKSNLIY